MLLLCIFRINTGKTFAECQRKDRTTINRLAMNLPFSFGLPNSAKQRKSNTEQKLVSWMEGKNKNTKKVKLTNAHDYRNPHSLQIRVQSKEKKL